MDFEIHVSPSVQPHVVENGPAGSILVFTLLKKRLGILGVESGARNWGSEMVRVSSSLVWDTIYDPVWNTIYDDP